MRADSYCVRWTSLLLTTALLSTSCASLRPLPGRGPHPARDGSALALAQGESGEAPRVLALHPDMPERPHRRRRARVDVTDAGPGSAADAAGSELRDTRQAVFVSVVEVLGSTRRFAAEFSRLKTSTQGVAGPLADAFLPLVDYGLEQQRWIDAELEAVTLLANAASEVEDPDMQLALLRLTGPRLEATMLGSLLLAAWVDHLTLCDLVVRKFPYPNNMERLIRRMHSLRDNLKPVMKALSSQEPRQVEAAAADLPALMGHLTHEFHASREAALEAARSFQRGVMLKELLETLVMASAMKAALPRLLPTAPLTLGTGLAMGSNGVMMGTQVVVSAEWVEMMRRLVQAGVLSMSAVSAAVRIRSGQVLRAQRHEELPRGVREALGDGPEVRAMRVTGKTGAGMAEPPAHHLMPQEFRGWFEKRGFTGKMSINQFCVQLELSHHQAIHGGGDWRLGRKWPGEWNRMIMETLLEAETTAGRMLTRSEILKIVAERMGFYDIPMNFVRCRGR